MKAGLRSAVVILASIVMMVSSKYLSRGHATASKAVRWNSLASTSSARLSQPAARAASSETPHVSRGRPFGVRPPFYQIRTQFSGTACRSSSEATSSASAAQPPSSSSSAAPTLLPPLCSHNITSDELPHTLFVYTDGSCQGNRNVFQNACSAGWAAVAVRLTPQSIESLAGASLALRSLEAYLNDANCTEVVELFGGVVTPSEGPQEFSLGAVVGSNNTGELCAIGEALLFVKDSYRPVPKRVVVMFDSEYAAKSVTGEYDGPKNRALILNIRGLLASLTTAMRSTHASSAHLCGVSFVHVRAHNSNFFNDRADALAKRGAAGELCGEGRYRR